VKIEFLRKSLAQEKKRGVTVDLDELLRLKYHARALSFHHKSRVGTSQAGNYLSTIRGRGIDFDEVRMYQPGDDIRNMDWRVTARTGKPHTKLYKEERERPIYILTDFGPSMFFGTRVAFKSVIAARCAALLAWAGINNGDRVGAFLFSGNTHFESKPHNKTIGLFPILKSLAEFSENKISFGPHSLTPSLSKLRHVIRPGSLVFILSDFLSLDEDANRHLSLISQHNDVVACYIYDPMERNLPPPNRYTISDGDDYASLDTSDKQTCREYRQQHKNNTLQLKQSLQKLNIPMINIATNHAIVPVLRKGLARLS